MLCKNIVNLLKIGGEAKLNKGNYKINGKGDFMKRDIENRVLEAANLIINSKLTIRQIAQKYGVCKSTIHVDLRCRLLEIKPCLVDEVDEILMYNQEQRCFRGGAATRKIKESKKMLL
jgi:putative DeoR family transcriptional regulator, stage III sporulation protein D